MGPWWAGQPAEPILLDPDIAGVRRVGTAAITWQELTIARQRSGLTQRQLARLLDVPMKWVRQPDMRSPVVWRITGRWLATCYGVGEATGANGGGANWARG